MERGIQVSSVFFHFVIVFFFPLITHFQTEHFEKKVELSEA